MKRLRIHYWADLTTPDLMALDRNRTVVLLPIGHTQPHGPHLPHGTLTFAANEITRHAAELLTLTDRMRDVVILPELAYGTGPVGGGQANRFPGAGSLSLGANLYGQLVHTIATEVARNKFHWLFALGFAATEGQRHALQAAFEAVMRQNEGFTAVDTLSMLNAGVEAAAAPDLEQLIRRRISSVEEEALATPEHAGTAATSLMLALNPNLVGMIYTRLEAVEEDTLQDADWPGYYGGPPAIAEADLGRALLAQRAYRVVALIRRVLSGESLDAPPPDSVE